ncbi:hypothetical protein TrRE_jg2486 [Triparma retinervis]|uniref:Uncharacterized protein n=1 Tax=Triparma retinervis TaxID=2557542 RepID=A0A9W7L8H3_9STRA|nr:hypothetical protein TrRE_jg2486 [Triparma retinervis]
MVPVRGGRGLMTGELPVGDVVVMAARWLSVRVMMGSGLIKLRAGDIKWKNFRAMDYFYETQPVPNPLSKFMHSLPRPYHTFEVLCNHVIELILPIFFLLPFRGLRVPATLAHVLFQFILISTGNLSFLNWLTISPLLFGLDDQFWSLLVPAGLTAQSSIAQYSLTCLAPSTPLASLVCGVTGTGSLAQGLSSLAFGLALLKLSAPVARNMMDAAQRMNGSFDKYRLVNTYGAFGVVTEARSELVVSVSNEAAGPFREVAFKAKPGDVDRRPRWCSPYHHRLDWCMWMAGLGGEGKARTTAMGTWEQHCVETKTPP